MARKEAMEMSLRDQLTQFDASWNAPPEIMAIIRRGIDDVRKSGPATYVLDQSGIVRAGQADPDYTVRMEPSDVVAALRNIARGP